MTIDERLTTLEQRVAKLEKPVDIRLNVSGPISNPQTMSSADVRKWLQGIADHADQLVRDGLILRGLTRSEKPQSWLRRLVATFARWLFNVSQTSRRQTLETPAPQRKHE